MSSFNWSPLQSSSGIATYANFAAFPATASDGTLALALDTDNLYAFHSGSSSWVQIGGPGAALSLGNLDSETATAKGANLVGGVIAMQSASAAVPGVVNTAAQEFAGIKTFDSAVNANGGVDVTSPQNTLAVGTANASIINIGNSGATVNLQGTTFYQNVTNLNVANKTINLNTNGSAGSASNTGIAVEENAVLTAYVETSADRNSWELKAPNAAGIAVVTPGASGITLNQSSHNPLTLGTANGLSLSVQALSLGLSSTSTTGALSSTDWNTFNNKQSALTLGNLTSTDITVTGGTGAIIGSGTSLAIVKSNLTEATSSVLTITGGTGAVLGSGTSIQVKQAATGQSGYLSSTDWNTFNGKQAAGNYITALTGDATAAGPGSAALTLATVNSNVGAFAIATVTVNAKGLVTAAAAASTTGSGSVVLATSPTLVTPTLGAASATSLSLGTALAIGSGGSGQTTANAALNAFLPSQGSSSGLFLKTDGTNTSWASAAGSVSVVTKTGTYTILVSDGLVVCDTSGGGFTVTLPAASGNSGTILRVVLKTAGNVLTIASNGGTIGPVTSVVMGTAEDSIEVCSDGTNWRITELNIGMQIKYTAANGTSTANAAFGYPTKVRDALSWYNSGTGRFTPAFPGTYQINARIYTAGSQNLYIYVNGVLESQGTGGSAAAPSTISGLVYLNGTGDYCYIATDTVGNVAGGVGLNNLTLSRVGN